MRNFWNDSRIYSRHNAILLFCAGVRQGGWLWSGWRLCSDPHRVGLDVQSTVGGPCPCRPKWTAQWQHSHEVNTCPKQRKSVSSYTRIVSIPRRTVSSILYKKISQIGSIRHWVSEKFYFTFSNSNVCDVCVTVHHWYNNINSQLDATIIILLIISISSTCFGL